MDAQEQFYSPDIFSDIPAAEQEVTVGSQGALNAAVSSSHFSTIMNNNNIVTSMSASGLPLKSAKIIRIPVVGSGGQQSLKTVKVITVPKQQGSENRSVKVIPASMLAGQGLQTVKVVTASQNSSLSSGTPGSGAKIITLRTVNSSSGTPTVVRMANNATLLSSGAASQGQVIHSSGVPFRTVTSVVHPNQIYHTTQHSGMSHNSHPLSQLSSSEDMEMMMHGSNFIKLEPHDMNHPGFYDFSRGGMSPKGDSGDENDQVTQSLKTNGLRKYARCVCDKVKEKNVTTYSEVADELVHEYAAEHPMIPSEQLHYIQKNIRRRVYDALNVLMALNVLQKEKKEIHWVGLPVNMLQECRRLEEEREKRQANLRAKVVEIQDLILELIAYKNLVNRNRLTERQYGPPPVGQTIELPFLVISTNRKTVIDCNIANDKFEYLFNFDQAFEIRDEVDTLKRMGLTLRLGTNLCTDEEYNSCLEIVPPSLRFYVEAMYERRPAVVPDFDALHQQRRMFVERRIAQANSQGPLSGGVRLSGEHHADHHLSSRPAPGQLHHHHQLMNSSHHSMRASHHTVSNSAASMSHSVIRKSEPHDFDDTSDIGDDTDMEDDDIATDVEVE